MRFCSTAPQNASVIAAAPRSGHLGADEVVAVIGGHAEGGEDAEDDDLEGHDHEG
jgi:hypothetical protein